MLIGIIGIFSSQLPLWKVDSTFGCQLFPIQHNLRKEVKMNEILEISKYLIELETAAQEQHWQEQAARIEKQRVEAEKYDL